MADPHELHDPLRQRLADALGAQYEVLHPLGRGGMGAVYLARELFLDRLVAVKVLPAEGGEGDQARDRFISEARTAARLTHPHIVPLHSFGQAGDTLFYVMGFVDGETLEARLAREGRLPHEDTRRILAEVADALAYAHAQGVVHRDVKPDNILLERTSGRAMLTDFGIARLGGTRRTTQTGLIVGTPQYMSPEQASGERELDGRSDLYSLGVMGYRMVAGRLPFEGANVQELLARQVTQEPVPLARVVPEAPPEVVGAIERALAKDPAARWPDGAAMRAAMGVDADVDDLLPDDLHGVRGIVSRVAGVSALVVALQWVQYALGWQPAADAALGLVALPTLAGGALVAVWLSARRHGWRRAWTVAMRQPRFWRGPWPRVGRHPGDVWDRLPRGVRIARSTATGAMVALSFLMAPLVRIFGDPAGDHRIGVLVSALGALVCTGAMVVAMTTSERAWMRAGRSRRDHRRVIEEPTWGSFWRRPDIAAVLAAPADATARSATGTPREQLRRIEAIARDAAPAAGAETMALVVAAAGRIVAAIHAVDAELAQVANEAPAGERARLESRLAELAPTGTGTGTGTVPQDAQQRMRALLAEQLELLRALEQRRADLVARRGVLDGHLTALRLQLLNLHAQAAVDAAAAAGITERLVAICSDVERHVAALDDVRDLLAGSRDTELIARS